MSRPGFEMQRSETETRFWSRRDRDETFEKRVSRRLDVSWYPPLMTTTVSSA